MARTPRRLPLRGRTHRSGPFAPVIALVLAACGSEGSSSAVTDAGSPSAEAGPSDAALAEAGLHDGGVGDAAVADGGAPPSSPPTFLTPRTGLAPAELGVLVNDNDPLSVQIAEEYVVKRGIPLANVVHLSLPMPRGASMTAAQFTPLKAQVDAALAPQVQALAITWTQPYRVDNVSITSAFALGSKTIENTCTDPNSQAGTPNPYSAKPTSTTPFTDFGKRPAMMIPATTFAEAQALIARGIAADDTWPAGSASLMKTSDGTRSARCVLNNGFGWTNECQTFIDSWDSVGSGIQASLINADSITGKTDVLFYVQGLTSVPNLATNTYLPGAIADHLTSFGGQVPTSGQMSAFAFLQAGVTGSFGTVVEPCAYQQKFPNPAVLFPSYFGGATLIEAYWRSVVWPAEGLFLGEPLARPFGNGFQSAFDASTGTLTVTTTTLVPGTSYVLEGANAETGPFVAIQDNLTTAKYTKTVLSIPNATRAFYRLRRK